MLAVYTGTMNSATRGRRELNDRQIVLVREALDHLLEKCGGSERGAKQKLATLLGVSGSSVTQWFDKKNAPSFATAQIVARAMKIPVGQLLEIDEADETDPYPNRSAAIRFAREAKIDHRAIDYVAQMPGFKSDVDPPHLWWFREIERAAAQIEIEGKPAPPEGRILNPAGAPYPPRPPRGRRRR